MIVRCENCKTEFSLDDGQVASEGVTVRCSVCAYVFRVEPGEEQEQDPPWQIRTVDDLLFTARDLGTLRQWIEEDRLHPEDRVSRTGKNWLRLRDIPEFAEAFRGVEGVHPVLSSIRDPSASSSAIEAVGSPPNFAGADAMPLEDEDLAGPPVELGPQPVPLEAVSEGIPLAPGGEPGDYPGDYPDDYSEVEAGEWAPQDELDPSLETERRSTWWIWAIAGVAACVGVVFGVPPIRDAVMGTSRAPAAAPEQDGPSSELRAAKEALEGLGTEQLSRAEAGLQRALDVGGHSSRRTAELRLAQADILVHRALLSDMAAALGGTAASGLRAQGQRDVAQAARALEGASAVSDGEALTRVRARLRLAEGRRGYEIVALLPEQGAEKTRLAIEAAALWRDDTAPVPEGLLEKLEHAPEAGALGRSILVVAYARAGKEERAEEVAKALREAAADNLVAEAYLRARAQQAEPPTEEKGEAEAKEDPRPSAKRRSRGKSSRSRASTGASGSSSSSGSSSGSRGGDSLEALIERGCGQVESGKAAAGIATLQKALAKAPNDIDVMICLGEGYKRQGKSDKAFNMYIKALGRSRNHRTALRGAADLAAKTGKSAVALNLYKRLLSVDPHNAKAQAYIAKHEAGGTAAQGSGGE